MFRNHFVAQVAEQVVANGSDDGIEEGHVFHNVGALVASCEVGVDSGGEVVVEVASDNRLEYFHHRVVHTEVVLGVLVKQFEEEPVEQTHLVDDFLADFHRSHLRERELADSDHGVAVLECGHALGVVYVPRDGAFEALILKFDTSAAGDLLRAVNRQFKVKSQNSLADALGVSQQYINKTLKES